MTAPHPITPRGRRAGRTAALAWVRGGGGLTVMLAVALMVGIAARSDGWAKPLWLDEVYTGVFARDPTLAGVIADVLNDVNGVVYPVLLWGWVQIAGTSDTALRLPSLLCSALTPLLILRFGPANRTVRFTWAGLVAVFLPLVLHAVEARCYALLFLCASLQATVLLRLLERPSLKLATGWTGLSAAVILIHYFSLPLVAFQGLMILAILRRRVLPLWPALIAFVPVALWIPFHAARLLMNFGPGKTWQPLLTFEPDTFLSLANDVVGLGDLSAAVLIGLLIALAFQIIRHRTAALAVPVASLLAIASVIVLGFLSPSYTERYIIVGLPGLLFGLALCAHRLLRGGTVVPALVLLTYSAVAIGHIAEAAGEQHRILRGEWAGASADLRARGARRLTFVWGLDQDLRAAPADLQFGARLGGFFLDRAQSGIAVTATDLGAIRRHPTDDLAVLAALSATIRRPHDAFLWWYFKDKRGPELSDDDGVRYVAEVTQAACRDYAEHTSPLAVIGCIRLPPPAPHDDRKRMP